MKKIVLIIFIALIFLSSCGSGPSKKTNLDDTLYKYASLVRWSDFDSALRFIKPGDDIKPPTNFELERLKQFKVTRYTESPIMPGNKENIIVQRVELQYYNIHSNITKTLVDQQSWEYIEDAKQWFLISGLPKL